MKPRIKKPAVRPELRRDWLRRHEEEGQSPPEIAEKDKYDVRTVRKQIEIERQERERREARSIVLRQALEKHYADLVIFAQKLDSHITGETGSLSILKNDPMWSALREHISRSALWKNLDRWETLWEEARQADSELKRQLEPVVRSRAPLPFPALHGEIGLSPGIVDLLAAHFIFTAKGEGGLDKRTDFRLEAAERGTTSMAYGPYNIGRVDSERISEVKTLVLELMNEVTTREEHGEMMHLLTRLERVKHDLHDELLIIILRRVVPGRCRYCPL
ncbi:MAG: hypothetical protein Q8O16_07155 [Dehalococcoidia bacterium]|nr:hypothetical protein [Dehalococcoidia bacterium]